MKYKCIIIPVMALCLGTHVSVDAADISQPFAYQELQNQAKEIAKWKADRESLPRIQVEKAADEISDKITPEDMKPQWISSISCFLCARNCIEKCTGRIGFLE